jgi:hypothetical protein
VGYPKLTLRHITVAQWSSRDSHIWISVARIAIMRGSKAEKQGYIAAKSALVVNVLVTMSFTVGLASPHSLGSTTTTDQFFRLDVAFSLTISTVVKSTIVWALASEAHVEGTLEEGILFQLTIKIIGWVLQFFILIQAFSLDPVVSLLLDFCLDSFGLIDDLCEGSTVVKLQWLVALGAIHKLEVDSRSSPSCLNPLLQTVEVEDMATAVHDTRLGSKLSTIADSAKCIFIDSLSEDLV